MVCTAGCVLLTIARAPHIVHSPLEVPPSFFEKFGFMEETDKPTHERQTYHAMVDFADDAIGEALCCDPR